MHLPAFHTLFVIQVLSSTSPNMYMCRQYKINDRIHERYNVHILPNNHYLIYG